MTSPENPPAFRFSGDMPRLKARAFEAIRAAGPEGASVSRIAASCLGSERVPPSVAVKIVASLLGGDMRVREDPGGRWALRDLGKTSRGKPILEAAFCVADVETTGHGPGARIIEMGAVRVKGLRLREEFQTLVNADVEIPSEIVRLTGITQDMISGAPSPERALDDFLDFLGDDVFCAHNAPFDRRFIFREAERFCLRSIKNPVLCTRLAARRALPELKDFSLDDLAARLSIINEMRHRALGDARAAAEILVHSAERLMERGVKTVEDLLQVQRKAHYIKFMNGAE